MNNYNFKKYLLQIAFIRNLFNEKLSLREVNHEQSEFVDEWKNVKKDRITDWKRNILKIAGVLFNWREKVLHAFKGYKFQITHSDIDDLEKY